MTRRNAADRALAIAATLVIAAYFWRLVRPTLRLYFTPDDSMNLFRAWDAPVADLVRANLLFFVSSHFIRPLAEAWYRVIYSFAGFNPRPFHAALLVILLINIWLTYAVARRLAGSREVGALAALIGCYNVRLADIYFDTGYIYDVLCYCFFFAAFLLYMRVRQSGRALKATQLATVWLLFVCALNSKEIAVTLPAFLLIYELLYHGRKWQAAGVAATAITAAVFIAGRSLGSDSLLHNTAYQPSFTIHQFLVTSCSFMADMLNRLDQGFPAWGTLAIWLAMLGIALLLRSRPLQFAWLFLMISPLPIAFILPRGAAQYYLPWFGWTLFMAALIAEIGSRIAPGFRYRGAVVFAAVLLILYPYNKRQEWQKVAYAATEEGAGYHVIVDQLHALHPSLPPRSRLYFVNDPIAPDIFDLLFLVRLSYHDDKIVVDRARQMKQPPSPQQIAAYDHVFDYRAGRFVEIKP